MILAILLLASACTGYFAGKVLNKNSKKFGLAISLVGFFGFIALVGAALSTPVITQFGLCAGTFSTVMLVVTWMRLNNKSIWPESH